jgi:hypothetical protein
MAELECVWLRSNAPWVPPPSHWSNSEYSRKKAFCGGGSLCAHSGKVLANGQVLRIVAFLYTFYSLEQRKLLNECTALRIIMNPIWTQGGSWTCVSYLIWNSQHWLTEGCPRAALSADCCRRVEAWGPSGAGEKTGRQLSYKNSQTEICTRPGMPIREKKGDKMVTTSPQTQSVLLRAGRVGLCNPCNQPHWRKAW